MNAELENPETESDPSQYNVAANLDFGSLKINSEPLRIALEYYAEKDGFASIEDYIKDCVRLNLGASDSRFE